MFQKQILQEHLWQTCVMTEVMAPIETHWQEMQSRRSREELHPNRASCERGFAFPFWKSRSLPYLDFSKQDVWDFFPCLRKVQVRQACIEVCTTSLYTFRAASYHRRDLPADFEHAICFSLSWINWQSFACQTANIVCLPKNSVNLGSKSHYLIRSKNFAKICWQFDMQTTFLLTYYSKYQ